MVQQFYQTQYILNKVFVYAASPYLRAGISSTQDYFNAVYDPTKNALRINIIGGGGIAYWGAPVSTPVTLPTPALEGEVHFVFDNGSGRPSLFFYESGAWHEFQIGDPHNKGFFASEAALRTAWPTALAGDFAIVAKIGAKDSLWVWDVDANDWIDTYSAGLVTTVFGRAGDVIALFGDYKASLIQNDSSVTGISVKDALDNLKSDVSMLSRSSVTINMGETKDVSIFDSTLYRTVEWLISTTDGTDGTYRSEKIIAYHDGTNVTYTRFAIIGKASVKFDVVKIGSFIRLKGTATKNAQTVKSVNIAVEI